MTDSSYSPHSGASPAVQPVRTAGAGMATAALVLGTMALITSFTVIGGILFGLIAIILGVVAVRRASRGLAAGRGRAIAGIILGALGLLLGVALVVAGVSILNSKQGKNLTSCLKDAGTDQSKVQACQTKFRDQTTNGS